MANRIAKQKEAEDQKRKQIEIQKQKEEEEAREKRKSQMEALKVSTIFLYSISPECAAQLIRIH